jgi:ABC-type enterochelin transport system substrate-binding protein
MIKKTFLLAATMLALTACGDDASGSKSKSDASATKASASASGDAASASGQ